MNRMWLLGAMVAVGSAGVIACGGAESDVPSEDLGSSVAAHAEENQCPEKKRFCRHIDGEPNITHVFIDFPRCFDENSILKVVANDNYGNEIRTYWPDDLHENGGPCGDIKRDFWFPLQGDQEYAEICVYVEPDEYDKLPKDVGVSFKYGGTCEQDWYDNDCKECDRYGNNNGPM